MKLIVGLGNPGQVYVHNRHNVGFMFLRYLSRTHGIKIDKKYGKARIRRGKVGGVDTLLARPQTYMNISGEAVLLLVKKFEVNLADLIIIHDDLDLPLGKFRISKDSGSGGHKGVDSVIYHLGSRDFSRLRIGIGRPVPAEEQQPIDVDGIVDYVLGDFTEIEKKAILSILPVLSKAVVCFITDGVYQAMNRFNQRV